MADRRVVIEQYLVDGTTPSQRAAVDSSGRVSVNLTASSATVTVDTELPAAAALADGASNPTTPTVGAAGLLWNGTTWDRRKSVATGQDSTGTGIAAVGIQAQLDDTSTTTVTENQFANLRLSSRRALLVEGVASGVNQNVAIAASSATVTVDSELPAAAALADATANPTVPAVGGFLMGYNGTTWDRVRTANTGRLQVDVVTGGGGTPPNMIVDNAAFTDGTTSVGVAGYIFDETAGTALTENDAAAARIDSKRAQVHVIEDATTRGQRMAVDASGRASVSLTASSATVTVDSELPAAAALADATSNPTVPAVGGFLMGYNGTTWDRVRTANTGRLQVDVVSGGGSDTPTSPVNNYDTSSAIAAGASDDHDTADLGGTTRKVAKVIFGATVPLKAELKSVINGTPTTIAVGFSPAGGMGELVPSHRDYWSVAFSANAGFDGFRLTRTNLDGSDAADVYSVIQYES